MESTFDQVLRDLSALARTARIGDDARDARMADETALADLVDALSRDSKASRGDTFHDAMLNGASIDRVISIYRASGAHSRARQHLLRLLAASGVGSRPLSPTEIYQIHKGRKLLRAFNA